MPSVDIQTQTDLVTGKKTYAFQASPVPVITPMGPAPGELRVETDVSGRVTSVKAVLRPRPEDVADIADLLAGLATFDITPDDLRGMVGGQPVITFALRQDALSAVRARVQGAADLQKLVDDPVLRQGERYAVDDVEVATV